MQTNKSKSIWTDERVVQLKDCIDRKFSGGRTADIMGMTSGAVVGKAHRMGLGFHSAPGHAYRKKSGGDNRKWKPMKKPSFVERPPPVISDIPPESLNISILELNSWNCHYPYGDCSPYLFCGHPVNRDGSPWCAYHQQIVYQKPQPRRGSLAIPPRGARL